MCSSDLPVFPHNFGDFELVEKNTDKSPGILRTGTEFAKVEYITSLARGHVI